MGAVREGEPHRGDSQQAPSSPRRFPASRCWLSALCGRASHTAAILSKRPPHRGDFQQGVAGNGRCVGGGCWDRALCGSGLLTAAILSKGLLALPAVRLGVAGNGRRVARPSSPRRFSARGCWEWVLCGPGLLGSGAVRLGHPHCEQSQQARARATLTAAILSKPGRTHSGRTHSGRAHASPRSGCAPRVWAYQSLSSSPPTSARMPRAVGTSSAASLRNGYLSW